jgi:hypothetical protein
MAPTLAERKERATTLPRLQMDEPMFSRNIPSAFSITSCPSDKEELSFSNSSPDIRPGDFDNR